MEAQALTPDQDRQLRELYTNAATGLGGREAFWRRVQRALPGLGLRKAQVTAWVGRQALGQVVNAKRPFKGFFRIIAPPRTFQIDFLFLSAATRNANRSLGAALFIAIDVLSRFMVVRPVKKRSTEHMVEALTHLAGVAQPLGGLVGVQADDEWDTQAVRSWCEGRNVMLSTDVAADDHQDKGTRLGIVDRACGTLKKLVRDSQVASDTLRIDLPALVENYNTRDHTGLPRGTTPEEAWRSERLQAHVFSRGVDHNTTLKRVVNLKPGDRVRRRVDRKQFDKGGAVFSAETYTIDRVDGNRYRLSDGAGKEVQRWFKYFELQKYEGAEGSAAGQVRLAAATERAATRRRVSRAKTALL